MSENDKARTRKFLQLMFQDYYRTHHDTVDIPTKVQNREFGMELWQFTWRCIERIEKVNGSERKVGCGKSGTSYARISSCPNCGAKGIQTNNWSRHIGFRSKDHLLNELVKTVPHSIYHSAAFYEVPVARNMMEKGWKGAELVFDIDADHLESPCAYEHDSWLCENPQCQTIGKGPAPEECPECKHTSFRTLKWLCDKCLEDAKKTTIQLYEEFLLDSFGFDEDEIQLNYSGHRGYHIRVNTPRILEVDSSARVEIAHFITGMGMNSTIKADGKLRVVPSGDLGNWQIPSLSRKIADAMILFIKRIDAYNGNDRWVEPLSENKDAAIMGLSHDPPILSHKVKGVGPKSWQTIAEKALQDHGAEIDLPVTHDIHRVIRLIGSLNGKTGFAVKEISRTELDEFDPFTDALVFSDEKLRISFPKRPIQVPKIRIDDQTYGPFNNETVEIPTPVGIFLLCKGMAVIE